MEAAPKPAIRVLLADDEPEVLEYLRILLPLEGFEVVGAAADANRAVELARLLQPDVALLDLSMPGGGLEAALRMRPLSPGTHVVVFSAESVSLGVLPLLSAGIDGYVVKGGSPDQIVQAIRSAVEGGAFLAPEVNRVALTELTSRLQVEDAAARTRNGRRDRIASTISGTQFHVALQPIIDLHNGGTHGVEALTRFDGLPPRPPEAWFGEAEEVGELTSLELATARAALRTLSSLDPGICMTVNISPATATSGRLDEALDGTDLDRVVLEVTEHSRVTDYPALTSALAPWREEGARVAVDDAGGGYASFAHILELSPDYIKLDISLVREIDRDPRRQALARAICGFAEELGVAVIAEGVETEAELIAVRSLGTPLAQGFYLGRPRLLTDQPDLLGERPVANIDLRDSASSPHERAESSYLRPTPSGPTGSVETTTIAAS